MNTYEKHNQSPFDDQLFKEQLGLERLRALLKNSRNLYLCIPTVYAVTAKKLCLESIDHKIATQQQMHDFGHGLALMHETVQRDYGLDHDNYIGLNRQKNGLWQEWERFFVEQRLEQQLSIIQDKRLASTFQTQLDQNKESLIAFLNKHCDYSSLLHGDLWSGNVLFDEEKVWLIDPAIYQGDREVDIAMTELFGGFSMAFYQAYDSILTRSRAYPLKREIYNLYHYLNHYNLFGDSYLAGCYNGFDTIASLAN